MNAAKSSHPTIQLKVMRYKKETETASATRLKIKRRKKNCYERQHLYRIQEILLKVTHENSKDPQNLKKKTRMLQKQPSNHTIEDDEI